MTHPKILVGNDLPVVPNKCAQTAEQSGDCSLQKIPQNIFSPLTTFLNLF